MRLKRSLNLGMTAIIAILVLSTATHAFDGKRKGFVAGLGGGVAPVIHWSSDYLSSDVNESGYGVNFLIGYAWNDKNIITYEGIAWLYELPQSSSEFSIYALDGARWYHYYGKQRRLFTSLGVGWFLGGDDGEDFEISGYGYTAGVGYEFLRQLQVGVYYIGAHKSSNSSTVDDFKVETNHSVLAVLVTLVAY
jgi:hypothetical protein